MSFVYCFTATNLTAQDVADSYSLIIKHNFMFSSILQVSAFPPLAAAIAKPDKEIFCIKIAADKVKYFSFHAQILLIKHPTARKKKMLKLIVN